MAAIEHFSIFKVFGPLAQKQPVSTSAAFSLHVLQYIGACVEVWIDDGKDFEGVFQEDMDMLLIYHRYTSLEHAQPSGLAECSVQTSRSHYHYLSEW
jgi:hypothetical protein